MDKKRWKSIYGLRFVLFLIIVYINVSCKQRYASSLVFIDSVSNVNADSAMGMLCAFDTLHATKADRMYYLLLYAKITDKLDCLSIKSNSAKEFITFFEQENDQTLLPMAYYYGGRVCSEQGNVPQALDYFRKSKVLLSESGDSALLSKVYSQMGYLFVERDMYSEALKYSQKSLEIDKAIADTVGMIYNLRDIGVAYKWNDRESEGLSYVYGAHKLACESGNELLEVSTSLLLADTYIDLNQLDSARKYGLPLLSRMERIDKGPILSVVSNIYYKENQIDSAEYYANYLLEEEGLTFQCQAHQILTDLCIRSHRTDSALMHYQKYLSLEYRQDKQNSAEAIAQANSAYNYQMKEDEVHQLRIANIQNTWMLVFFMMLSSITIIVVLMVAYLHRQKQMRKFIKLKSIQEELYRQSEEYKEKSKARIMALLKKLQDVETTNKHLNQEIENERIKLETSLEMSILRKKEAEQSLQTVRGSVAYRHILQQTDKGAPQSITNEEWSNLESIINQEYTNFTLRLYELCGKLSVFEYRVCLLLKANTELSKIAEILIKAQPTISTVRSRLYKKAFGKKGSAKDWDEVVRLL